MNVFSLLKKKKKKGIVSLFLKRFGKNVQNVKTIVVVCVCVCESEGVSMFKYRCFVHCTILAAKFMMSSGM